jgi:hypothetical protein
MASGVHTAIFNGSVYQNQGNGDTFSPIGAQTDNTLGIRNMNFIPTTNMVLLAAAAAGDGLFNARLSTPSTTISAAHIHPLNSVYGPQTEPNVMVCTQNPLLLRANEEITAEVQAFAEFSPSVSVPAAAVIWVAQQMEAVPAGESLWIRFMLKNSGVGPGGFGIMPNVWSAVPNIVFERSSLPMGRYAIIGIDAVGGASSSGGVTSAVAMRLVIPGEVMRPGALILAPKSRPHPMTTDGTLGVLGKFDAGLPPAIEVFVGSNSMSGAMLEGLEGYLRIIKIS